MDNSNLPPEALKEIVAKLSPSTLTSLIDFARPLAAAAANSDSKPSTSAKLKPEQNGSSGDAAKKDDSIEIVKETPLDPKTLQDLERKKRARMTSIDDDEESTNKIPKQVSFIFIKSINIIAIL